uniref:ADP-ribosylation factor-like protein 6 n=1 Tax=Panagrellus redivivus TaxID=6233 RepID=A0A7E4VAT8_PANRE
MVLLSILRKRKQQEKEIRLLILGLDASGKTTFMKKINGEDVSTISPTFGFNIETLEYKGWKLNLWDVGGQESLRSYWRNYFERTDGLIWVVDPWDSARVDEAGKTLHSLLNEEVLVGCSVLILVNKCDRGEVDEQAVLKQMNVDAIKGHHFKAFKTSAFTGENLLPALDWVCNDIASKVLLRD